VLELTWARVDLRGRRIDLGAAPGGKGRAIVPIGQKLFPLLEEARKIATCPYVIEHGSKPVKSVKTGTRAAARRAGLHGVTPHALRHTGATWMAMAGIPLDQISRLLAHSDPRLTLRVYAKHSPDYLKGAIDALTGPISQTA
jgi:integrase